MSSFKVAEPEDIVNGYEPTESTKVELKADPNETKVEHLTASIDVPDRTDLNMEKIQELRALLKEMNADYTDRDCQRFLIARNFVIQKSFEMIKKHHEWYNAPVSTFKIDNPSLRPRDMGLIETDNKHDVFNQHFPCSNIGQDKEGHPIYWEKSGYVASNWGNVKKHFSHDELTARHIRQQERMVQRCRNASAKHGKIIEKQVVIMDMKGVPVFVEWACFKSLKEVITVDEAFYPETLKNLFVINAPIYFTALYRIVKPWLDPLVIEKIQILGEDFYPTLSKYISDDVLPVEYGGKKTDFSWTHPTNFLD